MKQLTGNATLVDNLLKETTTHGTKEFPFTVYLNDFSDFQNGYICWHWHDEVQMTLISEGDFTCQVGNEKITMKPGEIIFINNHALHQITPNKKGYGKLYSFIWKPDILSENTSCDLYRNCIEPITHSQLKYVFWSKDNPMNQQLQSSLLRIINIMIEKFSFYELRIYNQLSKIWLKLCEYTDSTTLYNSVTNLQYVSKEKDEERVRVALQFMKENYEKNISLETIAKAAMTNRSELCKCFRRVLDITPNDFLIQYRIHEALLLLENPEIRISDIAEMTGFCSPSHFGTHFLKYVGCTPRQYRKTTSL